MNMRLWEDSTERTALPHSCVIHCRAFVLRDGSASSTADLSRDALSSYPALHRRGLELKTFTVTKNGVLLSPSFVDTGAQEVSLCFVDSDKPVKDGSVSGTFERAGQGHIGAAEAPCEITKATDEYGKCTLVLPPGKLSRAEVVSPLTGTRLVVDHTVSARRCVLRMEDAPEEAVINTLTDCSVLARLDTQQQSVGKVLVLGDCSGKDLIRIC